MILVTETLHYRFIPLDLIPDMLRRPAGAKFRARAGSERAATERGEMTIWRR
jgi:hypothetical protein